MGLLKYVYTNFSIPKEAIVMNKQKTESHFFHGFGGSAAIGIAIGHWIVVAMDLLTGSPTFFFFLGFGLIWTAIVIAYIWRCNALADDYKKLIEETEKILNLSKK